jgi:LacI family transcriptional regulator
VLEDFGDPFYSVLTGAVAQVVHREGYTLLTGSSAEDSVRERELVLNFCARRVDGLIVVPTAGRHGYLLPEIKAGVAAVFVDRPAGDLDADTVLSDNVAGVRSGVEHLISYGHRRIGFLGDRPDIFTATQRLTGYRAALTAAGLPVDESLIEMAHPSASVIRAALRRMLTDPDPATALFTGNSRITVAVLRELVGRPRPALVGFDDFELADLLTPGVTVVAQDPVVMGQTAATLLLRRLSGHRGPAQRISHATTLIPRGSGEIRP